LKDRLEVIKSLWGKATYKEIGKITKQSEDAVRKMGRKAGLPPIKINKQNKKLSPEQEVQRDVVLQNLGKETKQTKKKYEVVADKLADAEAMIEAFKCVGSSNRSTIQTTTSGKVNEATAVAVLSDVHFAETVISANVNGKNEYNPKIAQERLEKFFVSLVKLINIFGKESKIHTLILAILGDLVNGQLREEAMENNSMRPMDEMLAVKDIVSSGIRYLLENTTLDIKIHCHSGNHARVTKRVHYSTESGNSLEYVLYHILAKEFQGEERVEFIIPTSYHSFTDVGGVTIRFHHGHYMKYMGGVGGIYISVNKAIAQWNKAETADVDVFGHFHQIRNGGNFLCNGSVIGWNEFANSIKADFEKPKQLFFLVDHKRREVTVNTPIFLT